MTSLLALTASALPPAAAQEGPGSAPGEVAGLDAAGGPDPLSERGPGDEPPPPTGAARLGLDPISLEDMRTAHPTVFLERSYISYPYTFGSGFGNDPTPRYLFEGAGSLHLFARNGLVNPTILNSGGVTWSLSVSFLPVVRMLSANSEPVRIPTYRIRIPYLQLFRVAPPASRDSLDLLRFRLWDVAAGFTHYSNGQEGCFYRGFIRNFVTGECTVQNPQIAADSIVNDRNGDFSTSYLVFATHYRWGRLMALTEPMRWQATVGAEVQLHPIEIKPGGTSREQAAEYGQHQLTLQAEYERRFGWISESPDPALFAGVGRVAGAVVLRAPYPFEFGMHAGTGSFEASYVFDRALGLGPFVRVHGGPDPYNMRFPDEGPLLHVGVMWEPGRLDIFDRSPVVKQWD